MEILYRMNKSINYIEEHIMEDFDIKDVAQMAYSSVFHYQRMFHMLTGYTVAEYIRNRKLTLAAQEFVSGNARVLDIALKYGYDTPESFSKAFRKLHGINPSAARGQGAFLKAYPKLSFQISLKGEKDMNYKIIEREAYNVIGKAIKVATDNGENFKRIPKFWDECWKEGVCEELMKLVDHKGELLGICMEMDDEQESFTYAIAVESKSNAIPKGYVIKEIPKATWAVFESVGPMPNAIQDVWKRIYSEWFPSTGYEHAAAPEIEVYPEGDTASDGYRCEVWIPVIKK